MKRICFFLHTRHTAVIIPTPRTLEPPKQKIVVLLTTAIACSLGLKICSSDFRLVDGARPEHIVAVGTTAGVHACIADYDVAGVAPLVPEIIAYG